MTIGLVDIDGPAKASPATNIYKHYINKSTTIMNKEQMSQEQRAQLIEKLHNEYNDLNGKIARLNAFLNDIDFVRKVPDIIEQELMKGQLRAMENYLYNLRGRIMFQEARKREEKVVDDWMSMKRVVKVQRGPVRLINTDEQHHCGQDADLDDACCQVREKDPVGDTSAAVKDSALGEFQNIHIHKGNIPSEQQGCIKNLSLVGMQVIGIGDRRCEGCRQDRYGEQCVKLELVGDTYICLAPLSNSIVTE